MEGRHQLLEEIQGASHPLAFITSRSYLPFCSQTTTFQHLLSPCNILPQSIAPDLWSVLWRTLFPLGSTISFHRKSYCSVSLALQPQLTSRSVALACFLEIHTLLFSCTAQSLISTCSLLVSELQICSTIAFWKFILLVQLLQS